MLNNVSLLASTLFAGPAGSTLLARATCTFNGKDMPCGDLTRSIAQWGILGLIAIVAFIVICIFLFIFWLKMLIHAIKHNIEYKPVWILVLLLTGFLGAIVYYFSIRKNFYDVVQQLSQMPPPTATPPTASSG